MSSLFKYWVGMVLLFGTVLYFLDVPNVVKHETHLVLVVLCFALLNIPNNR